MVAPSIAAVIAGPVPGPTGTAAFVLTLQALVLSGKNLSPQFTFVSVWVTTSLIAGISSAHFDCAPHEAFGFMKPPSEHVLLLMSSFIEPERSRRIKMSGGTFMPILLFAPQLRSGVETAPRSS